MEFSLVSVTWREAAAFGVIQFYRQREDRDMHRSRLQGFLLAVTLAACALSSAHAGDSPTAPLATNIGGITDFSEDGIDDSEDRTEMYDEGGEMIR